VLILGDMVLTKDMARQLNRFDCRGGFDALLSPSDGELIGLVRTGVVTEKGRDGDDECMNYQTTKRAPFVEWLGRTHRGSLAIWVAESWQDIFDG
jgi:hypothetical protein